MRAASAVGLVAVLAALGPAAAVAQAQDPVPVPAVPIYPDWDANKRGDQRFDRVNRDLEDPDIFTIEDRVFFNLKCDRATLIANVEPPPGYIFPAETTVRLTARFGIRAEFTKVSVNGRNETGPSDGFTVSTVAVKATDPTQTITLVLANWRQAPVAPIAALLGIPLHPANLSSERRQDGGLRTVSFRVTDIGTSEPIVAIEAAAMFPSNMTQRAITPAIVVSFPPAFIDGVQRDQQTFSLSTADLEVCIPNGELKLPGGFVLEVTLPQEGEPPALTDVTFAENFQQVLKLVEEEEDDDDADDD